ncbi:hypothetical protein GGX14DRAFT_403409 [Mycena pura]|uniref:Uncharacterized protein n=1 Tax=Mycena pura TaxID=153505 RepID=A0AAD6V355_9AGAR|nr:hypothetical protein GGX14DRAFT_403409 [Mycena pura]
MGPDGVIGPITRYNQEKGPIGAHWRPIGCLGDVKYSLVSQLGPSLALPAPNWPTIGSQSGPAGPASPYWGPVGPASPYRPTIGRQSCPMWPNLTRRRPTGPNWAMGPHGEINKLATWGTNYERLLAIKKKYGEEYLCTPAGEEICALRLQSHDAWKGRDTATRASLCCSRTLLNLWRVQGVHQILELVPPPLDHCLFSVRQPTPVLRSASSSTIGKCALREKRKPS